MRLEGLVIADEPATWAALGFAVDDQDVVLLGDVAIRLAGAGAGEGIVGWSVAGLGDAALDGLPAPVPGDHGPQLPHPNGALAVDHVVAVSGDIDRTLGALAAAGLEPRRIREIPGGDTRQAFFVLETALLELAGPTAGESGARLWGLTLVVADL